VALASSALVVATSGAGPNVSAHAAESMVAPGPDGPVAPVAAQGSGDLCLSSPPAGRTRPSRRLRFGVTPRLAGSEGASQQPAVPVDGRQTQAALHDLEPARRTLVLRLNRLFSADGRAGIRRFARQVDRHARDGFNSEVQVRYHPRPAREGDMDAWARFVRRAVGVLGERRSVVAFSIVNEANLPLSPNTSDGAYERVIDAVVRGIVAGRRELRRIGRPRVPLGFTVAWRYLPQEDARFWSDLGRRATPRFRRALDYVGLQVYPGLFWPPVIRPGRTAGYEVAEAATLVRRCFMPQAGLGRETDLWISENGYSTRQAAGAESEQARNLSSTVRALHRLSGTLGITDYRYFNLRDNRSTGTGLFDQVGLLFDDYERKRSFGVLRGLMSRFGR
jgi:hypothetical protein